MYKRIVASLCLGLSLLLAGIPAFSQEKNSHVFFSHSIGFTGFGGITPDLYQDQSYTAFGFTYSPRVNFLVLSPASSFSFGTHLTFGGSFSASTDNYGDTHTASTYMADIPLVLEYNFGNAATREAFKRWGFFVGGGYGWHNARANVDYEGYLYPEDVHLAGPVFNVGMRFPIALASLGIRFSYLSNNHAYNPEFPLDGLFGFGVEYNFGSRTRPREKKQHTNFYHKR